MLFLSNLCFSCFSVAPLFVVENGAQNVTRDTEGSEMSHSLLSQGVACVTLLIRAVTLVASAKAILDCRNDGIFSAHCC